MGGSDRHIYELNEMPENTRAVSDRVPNQLLATLSKILQAFLFIIFSMLLSLPLHLFNLQDYDFTQHDTIKKLCPHGFHSVDKEGRPIFIL